MELSENFFEKMSHALTVLINSVMHNKSLVPPFKLNNEFS